MAFERWSGIVAELDDVLLPETTLRNGRYRILSFLSSGGFGIAYLARDADGREVVIKECFVPEFCRRTYGLVVPRSDQHRLNFQKALAGFLQEASVLATLTHPNIVRAHRAFRENDTAYIVLDLIKGQDLHERLTTGKTSLAPSQLVRMATRMVSALGHVHDRGFLHCDVAPDNICIGTDGEPVLIDFGSARPCLNGASEPYAGFSMVKDGYSPHELYTPKAACGPSSDLYSLGATLCHAISGTAPADGQSRLTALVDGLPDPLPPLAGRIPGYPPGFLASIDRAMAVRASDRFATAKDWLRAMARPEPTPLPSAATQSARLDSLRLRA